MGNRNVPKTPRKKNPYIYIYIYIIYKYVCYDICLCVYLCVCTYIDSCNCCVLAPFGVKISPRLYCWKLLTPAKKFCELLIFHRDFRKKIYFTRFCMYFSNVHFSWKNHHFFVCNSFTYDWIQLRFLQKTWNIVTLPNIYT